MNKNTKPAKAKRKTRLEDLQDEDLQDATSFYAWDKNLSFDKARLELETAIISNRNRYLKARAAILLIQLRNGSRIGEAIAAAILYAKKGKKEVRVLVEKRKKNDPYWRIMRIPEVVRRYPQIREEIIKQNSEVKSLKDSIRRYAAYNFEINTHALRYAYISEKSNTLPAQKIANITGHKTMDMILHYTNRRSAEDDHRKDVK